MMIVVRQNVEESYLWCKKIRWNPAKVSTQNHSSKLNISVIVILWINIIILSYPHLRMYLFHVLSLIIFSHKIYIFVSTCFIQQSFLRFSLRIRITCFLNKWILPSTAAMTNFSPPLSSCFFHHVVHRSCISNYSSHKFFPY